MLYTTMSRRNVQNTGLQAIVISLQQLATAITAINASFSISVLMVGQSQSGKTAFRDLAPGSLNEYNEDEKCHLGDNCPFTHKGREIAQEELAVKKEQALGSAASSSLSGPPQYGRSGLSRAAE